MWSRRGPKEESRRFRFGRRWGLSSRTDFFLLPTSKTTTQDSITFDKVTWVLRSTLESLKKSLSSVPSKKMRTNRLWDPWVVLTQGTKMWWNSNNTPLLMIFAFEPTDLNNKRRPNPPRETHPNSLSPRTHSSTKGVSNHLPSPQLLFLTCRQRTHLHKTNTHPVSTQIRGATNAKA